MSKRLYDDRGFRTLVEVFAPVAEWIERVRRFAWAPVALLALVYLFSGITFVQPDQVALVKRFGRLVGDSPGEAIHPPGLLLAWPRPIDRIVRVNTQRIHEVRISDLDRLLDSQAAPASVLPEGALPELVPAAPQGLLPSDRLDPRRDGYSVTGDQNILHVGVVLRFRIDDPIAYALRYATPERLLKDIVASALIQSIGESSVDTLLAGGRQQLPIIATQRAQTEIDALELGLAIISLELESLRPPERVRPAFEGVQSASIEAVTAIQEALRYSAEEIPRAQADADRQLRTAEAYRAGRLARARADANVFQEIYAEYRQRPEVVKERLYRESIERAIHGAGKQTFVPPPAGKRYGDMRISIPKVPK